MFDFFYARDHFVCTYIYTYVTNVCKSPVELYEVGVNDVVILAFFFFFFESHTAANM